MQPTAPFSDMTNVHAQLVEVVINRRLRYQAAGTAHLIQESIIKELFGTRLFMIREEKMFKKEWDKIRKDELVLDFLLGTTIDLRSRLAMTPWTFEKLIEVFADAFGQFTTEGDDNAIDKDLVERLGEKKKLVALYTANPWFITMILLDQVSSVLLSAWPSAPAKAANKG